MKQRLTSALAVVALATAPLAVVGLSPVAPVAPAAATQSSSTPPPSQRVSGALRVSPERFVGGQALTFVGRIPAASDSRLKIQTLFNRPGDRWVTRPGVVGRSNDRGEFRFVEPGPSNYKIRYRVRAANGRVSAPVQFEPRQQEVVLSLGGAPVQQPGRVASGSRFSIMVNTTPTGRGDLGRPAPAFPGRTLALQERVAGNRWATIDTAPSTTDGTARFDLTAGAPGRTAYRIRQAAITSGVNEIGWFPSFPLQVQVLAPGARPVAPHARRDVRARAGSRPIAAPSMTAMSARSGGGGPQASKRYTWGAPQWDFAWEGGESLTDKPYRGRKRAGAWIDRSNGSGRVAHYNGGMALASNVSEFPGTGDNGTVSATLTGNALTYGRWEFRRRLDVFESSGHGYRAKIQLVPASAADGLCGANTVTVADVGFNSKRATLGVRSSNGTRAWTGSRRIARLGDRAHTFGIEITRRHITWFLDGRSMATVRSSAAIPGVPLTPRLSLIGNQQEEMQRTRVIYDWQRGWTLNKQARKAKKGRSLRSKNVRNGCRAQRSG